VIAEKEFLSPGLPSGAGADEPPLGVRQGGGPFSAGRSHRRRRSASPLPPPPIPAEMPYDTAGRVVFLGAEPPPDVRPDPAAEVEAGPAPPPRGEWLGSWIAVAVAAALILVVFLVGMGITR